MKIILTAGGTMGHIKPALTVLKALINEHEITYIGNKDSRESECLKDFPEAEFFGLKTHGLTANFQGIKALFECYQAYHKVYAYFLKIRPDKVIAFGGYVTAPVLMAARKLHIPYYLHEQNSIPGKVNQFFYPDSKKTLISFSDTLNQMPKAIVTGNPITQLIHYEKTILKYNQKKRLLFIGGSNGAEKINEIALNFVDDYQVVLITGKKYDGKYQSDKAIILPYYPSLTDLMIESDIIISRSGATTMAEIEAIGKPVIFVPSPNVSSNHQEINASILFDRGACLMIKEKDLTVERLKTKIDYLLNNRFIYEQMIRNQHEMNIFNSLSKVIQEIF